MQHPVKAMIAEVFRFSPLRVRWALALSLVASIAESVGLALLVPVLKVLSAQDDGDGFAVALPEALSTTAILGFYIVIIALTSWLVWRRNLLLSKLRHDFIADLSKRAHHAAIRQPPVWVGAQRRADLTYLMSQDVSRTGQGVQFIFTAAASLIQLPALAALAIALSPFMALSAAVLIGAVVLMARPFDHHARQVGGALGRRGARLFARADETVAHLPLIKTHGAERRWIERYDAATDDLHNTLHDLQAGQATAQALTRGGGAIGVTLVVWVALAALDAPIEEIAVLVLVMMRMLPLVSNLHQAWRSALAAAPAHERVKTLIEARHAAPEPLPPMAAPTRKPGAASLSLEQVAIHRTEAGPATLPSLSMILTPGTLTAVTGASGAGKSTLGLAVAGLLPIRGGTVTLDGAMIEEPRFAALRRESVLVAQDPALFHDTLAANLRIADADAPEDTLWRALRAADAEGFVSALPEKLETIVGDRGARLSGGERQRVALAQALLARPRLLVLDEATSALDAETEERVFSSLMAGLEDMTILFMTHRTAFLEQAHQVVTLTHGHAAPARTGASD